MSGVNRSAFPLPAAITPRLRVLFTRCATSVCLTFRLSFDIRQVTHAYTTYDLPFGKGKAFLSNGNMMNRLVGGFSVGTVITYQNGAPFRVTACKIRNLQCGSRLGGVTLSSE